MARWSDLRKQADARRDALMLLLALGGTGLGVGAAARGVIGAHDAIAPSSYDPLMHTSSIPTPLPVPIFSPPKKKKQLAAPMKTQPMLAKAAEALRKHADGLQDWANRLIPRGLPGGDLPEPANPTAPVTPNTPAGVNPLKSQWGIPAALLTAGTGLVGGWHLMGALADKTKANNTDTELQTAEEDYQQALAEQYRAALRAKKAEDTLGIDDLFDAYVKQADPAVVPSIPFEGGGYAPAQPFIGDNGVAQVRGAVDAASVAAALGGGYLTYNWMKKRNNNKILEKAVQLRARQRQFTPAPFYAVTSPVAEGA